MENHNNSEQMSQGSVNTVSKTVSATKKAINTGTKIAKEASKAAAATKSGGLGALFSSFMGTVGATALIVISVVIVVVMLIAMIISSTPPNMIYSSTDEDVITSVNEEIKYNMSSGYNEKINSTQSSVLLSAKDIGCDGNRNNVIKHIDENGNISFSYNSRSCDLNYIYEPSIDTYVNEVTGYFIAYNGVITLYDGNNEISEEYESGHIEIPNGSLTKIEEGDIVLTDNGKELLNQSEYTQYQSNDFVDKIKEYSETVFDAVPYSEWNYDVHTETRSERHSREVCYIKAVKKGQKDTEVPCYGSYDYSETEYYNEYYDVQVGTITVPMKYEMDNFKSDLIENCVNNLIGTAYYESENSGDIQSVSKKYYDEQSARAAVENQIQDYYMTYIMSVAPFEYGEGYSGMVTSNGWDYSRSVGASNTAVANQFWAYSMSLKDILYNLEYQTDYFGGPPSMTHQCTQFAATWFYDVHGFAALRGNGDMMAYNIVKDCGSDSSCPVKFELSNTPAPGAVLSVTPNHVVVVDAVYDDGSVIISQGNVKGGNIATAVKYDSISDYCSKNGKKFKAMAIPIQD